ncbi:hypothetical protein GS445_17820 [Rhodococcus hoagii]|nr:hypothetical protein [Prescottella equi]
MATYDDLAAELGIDLSDPNEALVRDLALADDGFLEDLVRLRKDRGMTQQDVAEALGRALSDVIEFESLGADHRFQPSGGTPP